MSFKKYNVSDNWIAVLDEPIDASTTSFIARDVQNMPSSNFTLTAVKKVAGTITSTCKIYIGTRSGNTFSNVVVGYAGDSGKPFSEGDELYLNIIAEHITDIQNELVRLNNDKANNNWWNTFSWIQKINNLRFNWNDIKQISDSDSIMYINYNSIKEDWTEWNYFYRSLEIRNWKGWIIANFDWPTNTTRFYWDIKTQVIKGINDLKIWWYNLTRFINFDDNWNIDYNSWWSSHKFYWHIQMSWVWQILEIWTNDGSTHRINFWIWTDVCSIYRERNSVKINAYDYFKIKHRWQEVFSIRDNEIWFNTKNWETLYNISDDQPVFRNWENNNWKWHFSWPRNWTNNMEIFWYDWSYHKILTLTPDWNMVFNNLKTSSSWLPTGAIWNDWWVAKFA